MIGFTEDDIEELKKYFDKKCQRKKRNIERMKKLYNDNDSFNVLMQKILDKHTDELSDRFYKNGIQPHPLNILYSIFDIFQNEGNNINPFDEFTINFSSIVFEYMNWQISITNGQGSVCSVYHNKNLKYRE